MVTVAVDIMGADKTPQELLHGVADALDAKSDLEVLVVGAAPLVEEFCNTHPRAHAVVSTQVIGMDEHPAHAVRAKSDASIVVAAHSVRQGKAQGLFSAGSTGAVLTAATFGIGRIRGIKRPALALAFPGKDAHKTVILDLGANADVRPETICQFAFMGAALCTLVVGVTDPRIGLLNNGSEEQKGSELSLSYHAALKESGLNFVGNAEGDDLLNEGFDVVVTDGFSGNVALKSTEGAAKFMLGRIKASLSKSWRYKLGALLLKPVIKGAGAELSGDAYGGAILLGLKAPVVKGHGSTTAFGVKNGILQVAHAVEHDLVGSIDRALAASREHGAL